MSEEKEKNNTEDLKLQFCNVIDDYIKKPDQPINTDILYNKLYKIIKADVKHIEDNDVGNQPQGLYEGGKLKYKKTNNKVKVIYKKKTYERTIYKNKTNKHFVKIDNKYLELSKLKKV